MSPAAALALAAGLAVAGAALGWLTPGGAVAATTVGAAVLWGSGLPGGVLLAVFFVSGSALTYARRKSHPDLPRPRRYRGRVWRQVAANGGWAATGAWIVALHPPVGWPILVGSLAAAQADTWGTEIGRLSPRPPRLITSGRRVPPGTSGAVSWLGTVAGIAGAGLLSAAAALLGVGPSAAVAGLVGGITGTVADSVLGATVQGRFHCVTCDRDTEQARHDCPDRAAPAGGIGWIDNDVVNLLATTVGAGVALGVAGVLGAWDV
ncbi:MAG: DUF92 domain-containing protein [Gemmatimonadota bacterium]|nr:MAG: DUF92 domain-containing protein [Gemmatimonadota bacterium]